MMEKLAFTTCFKRSFKPKTTRTIMTQGLIIALVGISIAILLAGNLYSPEPTSSDPSDTEAPVTGHAWLYFAVLAAVAGAFYMAGSAFSGMAVAGFNIGYIIWITGVMYFVTGFQIIGPEELAGLQFWGKPTIVVTGSPVIVLPGLFKIDRFSRGTIQMELPDEPENIFRDEDVSLTPSDKVPPVRVTFAQGSDVANDPLNERITAEVSVFVRFRIEHFWSFFVRIGDFKEARKQLSDSVVSELQTELGKMTVAETFANKAKVDDMLDNLVRDKTKNWGIQLIDVRLKLIGLSHDLNKAISRVAQSVADKKSAVNTADANAYTLTKAGEGEANAIKAKLDAESESLKKRAEDLNVNGADVLGARVAEAMGTSASSKVILGADGLIDIGKMLAERFSKK
jgi:regulator of protease activity HflC (stomatin/prohibitin superfamily)